MTDDRGVRLETTGGWQPGPSGGERILVGLATIALLGAVVIVAGNLLPHNDATSKPSNSPRPTARATPVPTPVLPVELGVVPATLPSSAPTEFSQFYGWIRAKVDLPILSDHSEFGTPSGTLPAGSLAYAHDQPDAPRDGSGWLYVDEPAPGGWVATMDGGTGTQLVTRYGPGSFPVPGSIWTLEAGPQGYMAIGQPSSASERYGSIQVFASTDGDTWRAATEPPAPTCCWANAAWGPSGWLLVGSPPGQEGGDTWIWTSPDGLRWDSPGVIKGSQRASGYPVALRGSEMGYLLMTSYGNDITLWFSADGRTWLRSNTGQPTNIALSIAALPTGFYAWTDVLQSNDSKPFAAYSADGQTWVPAFGGPDTSGAHVVGVGDVVVAMEADPATGSLRVWRGTIDGDRLTWAAMPGAAGPFMGARVSSLASDGRRAVALGWDRTTEAPLAWSTDGASWTRDALPADFEGIAGLASGGSRGVVAVGTHWNTRGANPIVWHRSRAGRWTAEQTPVIAVAADLSPASCIAPPADAVEFMSFDRPAAVACLGSRPITIRAWSSKCDGCDPGQQIGGYDPAWLALPTGNVLRLSPIRPSGNWVLAVLDPNIGPVPAKEMLDTWLEVTGHFDDPAAATCVWTPPPQEIGYYTGSRWLVEGCRQQFVVTAVRVIDGP